MGNVKIPQEAALRLVRGCYERKIYLGFQCCLRQLDEDNNQGSFEDRAGNKFTVSRIRPDDESKFIYSFRLGERTVLTGVTDPHAVNWSEYRNIFKFVKITGY